MIEHPGDVPWAASDEKLSGWVGEIERWAEQGTDWEGKVAEVSRQLGIQTLQHLLQIERHLESLS